MPLIVPLYCLMVYDCKLIFFIKYKFLNAPSLSQIFETGMQTPSLVQVQLVQEHSDDLQKLRLCPERK